MYATMIQVDSRSIRAVDYDGSNFFVQFHTSDTIYVHPNLPTSVFVEFMAAESKGEYYNQHVRGRYR